MERLPDKGVYLLLIFLPMDEDLSVGALGEKHFRAGYYVYVGSAQRNLKKRIERHLRREKRKRWHIDYLLSKAEVRDVLAYPWEKEWEERIAKAMGERYPGVKGFGASDSGASSHLFYLKNSEEWEEIKSLCEELYIS
ncbi:hypothetical protein B6U71_03065 [Euryarchaeota archaeon ex4484_178]|nr:MAG: hypothetical protein B6U71_03065 [Euryarchaeota archaeon ex4484_178]